VFVDAGQTVASHRPDELPATLGWRAYRVRSTDHQRLVSVLGDLRVDYASAGGNGLDVHVYGGESAAARLLAELVGTGVPVTSYAPVGGNLEAAYLHLTQGGQP